MESESDLHSSFIYTAVISLQAIPSLEVSTSLVLLVVLLACSALISSSEVAFFSLTHNDINALENEETKAAQRIIQLKERPRRLLATILISNNFINIAIVILSEFLLRFLLPVSLCERWADSLTALVPFNLLGAFSIPQIARAINFTIAIVGVTALLVLFGEVAPKIYAKLNNIWLAKLMSYPLVLLNTLFNPLSRLLVSGTNAIEKRLANRTSANVASKEEIDEAIELTVSHEKHAKQEIGMLKGIVKFGDVTVKQIMRSRVDVVAVDFRIGFSELLKVVKESGFSRIPVYDEDFDHVTGILYVKDLLGHLEEGSDFEWQELIRTNVLYVPEAKKINDLLKEFQKQRLHIAIVVDEYGGSSGIVTLEDIMEEIIGEIKDETDDEEELEYVKIDDYNYTFEGKTLLNDVCRIIGVDTNTFDTVKGDADSVAGLILEILGYIPKADVELSFNGYKFKTISVNKRRIEKIQITLPKP